MGMFIYACKGGSLLLLKTSLLRMYIIVLIVYGHNSKGRSMLRIIILTASDVIPPDLSVGPFGSGLCISVNLGSIPFFCAHVIKGL